MFYFLRHIFEFQIKIININFLRGSTLMETTLVGCGNQ